jgi:hypothetical protein
VNNDNDLEGADCDDSDCVYAAACNWLEDCFDPNDADGDGDAGCYDGECQYAPVRLSDSKQPCREICDNDIDDDGDGLVDCLDPFCFQDYSCAEVCEGIDDTTDDDGDGAAGCQDLYCAFDGDPENCQLFGGPYYDPIPQCFDYKDSGDFKYVQPPNEDGEGGLLCSDFRGFDVYDNTYGTQASCKKIGDSYACMLPFEKYCDDDTDGDGDGDIDCYDLDCANDNYCLISEWNCTDKIDNNDNGLVDCEDSNCTYDPACLPGEVCDDTVPHHTFTCTDEDDDQLYNCTDPDCFDSPYCLSLPDTEGEPGSIECTDEIDNDGDCEIQCADEDCIPDDCDGDGACEMDRCEHVIRDPTINCQIDCGVK